MIDIQASALSYLQKLLVANDLNAIRSLSQESDYKLCYEDGILTLKQDKLSFNLDLLNKKEFYRLSHLQRNKEALLKALSYKGTLSNFTIADSTAGLGRDAMLIACASHDCKIIMFERNPLVYALLYNAYERAQQDERLALVMKSALILNSYQSLVASYDETIDIIYYDPMFEARHKSAKVAKNMQIFHDIVGFDTDIKEVLTKLRSKARLKTVVKRGKDNEAIHADVSYSIDGGACRFDIYMSA